MILGPRARDVEESEALVVSELLVELGQFVAVFTPGPT